MSKCSLFVHFFLDLTVGIWQVLSEKLQKTSLVSCVRSLKKTTSESMDTLIEYIASERKVVEDKILSREATIAALSTQISVAQAEISILQSDLGRLDKAEAALRGQPLTVFKSVTPPKSGSPTIKKMALAVLTENPEGLAAIDILSKINARFSKSYSRTSLSPQLSRLFNDGEIHKRGKLWVLGPSLLKKAVMERKAAREEPM